MAPQAIFLLKHTQKRAKNQLNFMFSHFFLVKLKPEGGGGSNPRIPPWIRHCSIYGWRGIEIGGLGDDSPPVVVPFGKFKLKA